MKEFDGVIGMFYSITMVGVNGHMHWSKKALHINSLKIGEYFVCKLFFNKDILF